MSKNKSSAIELLNIAPGLYWLSIEEPNLRLLGGVIPDAMKHLAAKDMISPYYIKDVYSEHGPNTILLNEELYVQGMVANLSEFPILQMLYMQGMGLSFHPNFKEEEPLIIGLKERVESQLKYINYGNNGLNYLEMVTSDLPIDKVELWYYMKARFAGTVNVDRLINTLYIKNRPLEIKPGVMLDRKEKNVYQITYKGQSVVIDLNLDKNISYGPIYQFKKRSLPQATFAVVNTGTGDGWNFKEHCFGSLLVYNNHPYLVDCEIFTQHSLDCLSTSQDKLKGIFMTHAHDDHMSGLPTIYHKGKPILIYATNLIYHSLMYKIMALIGISESEYRNIFKHHELVYDKWNDVQGLEVKPVHSAHPIETSIFFFRVKDEDGIYKTYAHLGDVAPLKMINDFRSSAITDSERNFYDKMIKDYMKPVDLKKIDIGGGMIHGDVSDFNNDESTKIVLGHYHRELTSDDLKVGVSQKFGDCDILIP
ncbi:MAG: MBL fold metallo-hydrolase [SAR324 cluster bacterium]|nr:MBL fold metallo-hydrolase [SAR324 cluster bacterium]